MSLRAGVFWVCSATAGWVLAGYPAALATTRRRPWRTDAAAVPRVSVIVPAYNERELLPQKLRGLAELDYPADRVEVLVPVDQDETLAALAAEAHPGAKVLFSAERGGKSRALDRALEMATGDIVLMTDANNLLEPGSLRAAARHFADPAVWAVAGRRGELGSAYDRYEDLLRRLETRSGSVAAMSGEFMAVRRERLPPFPEGIVNDDLWLLCQLVREGGRVVYDPEAASIEPPVNAAAELTRRSRIGAGRVMLLGELRGLPAGFTLRLLSHKFGRLALPFLLLAALLTCPYRVLTALQIAGYGTGAAAAAGHVPPGPAGRVAKMLGQFVLGNAAIAAGTVRGLRGRQSASWDSVR